jgi:hypothetical protein
MKTTPTQQLPLGILLALLALNAFGGGIYGMMGAEGVPVELLRGTVFPSFFIPSLILFVVVGGSATAASVAVLAGLRYARWLSLMSAFIVFAWIAVQVAMIGYVSVLQPIVAGVGVIILVLAGLQKPV